ncbi:MAG: hypothetical protein QXO96_05970 [Sulfolobales archaeon]
MNEELNKAVASLLKSGDRKALAELIVEFVEPNHLTREIVNLILPSRSLNVGDALVKKVRRGIEVRTLVPGSVHLASEITVEDRINFILDGADIKVHFNEWDLENGDIGTIESIRAEMAAKLADFYINKVFNSLSTVWNATNTPDNYVSVGGLITPAVLEDAIDQINQTTTGAKIVVGTRKALTPTTKFLSLRDAANNRFTSDAIVNKVMETGWLGVYYGVPILALDQIYDNPADYRPMLPDDKVLVVGENVGEFITYGPVREKQWTDMEPTPPMWKLEIYQQFGMIIDNAQGIYVIGNLT